MNSPDRPRYPRSISTAISLIEAERRDLYGQLKALDDALAHLRGIERDVQPDVQPAELSPAAPKPKPARRRRSYSTQEKEAGVRLSRQLGTTAAAKQIGVAFATLRDWEGRVLLDEVPPSLEVSSYEAAVSPTETLLKKVSQGHRLRCSCGKEFDDTAGWQAHNGSLRADQMSQHKLTVVS